MRPARWRSRRLLVVAITFLAAIWLTSAVSATAHYFLGTARLQTGGEPPANLDRDYRLHWEQLRGPGLAGWDPIGRWLLRPAHNLVVTLLVRVLGPMHGAYDGPYPTASQAWESLEDAPVSFRVQRLCANCLVAFEVAECGAVARAAAAQGAGDTEARCAVFEERTLVIGTEQTAILIDRGRGEKYAVYDFGRAARWDRGGGRQDRELDEPAPAR
jgi:hypothetical protein